MPPEPVPHQRPATERRDPSTGRAWYRRPPVLATGGLAVAAALVAAGFTVLNNDPSEQAGPAASAQPGVASTPAPPAPTAPPARICGNPGTLAGPATAPAGAVVVKTTQNLNDLTTQNPPGTTFWLSPGTHRLGTAQFAQVIPKDGNVYVGAPGAILDGSRKNRYAFAGYATGVTIRNLTIQNFGAPRTNNDEGVVNHDAGPRWTVQANTIQHNAGAGLMIGDHNVVRSNCLAENGQYGFNAYNPGKVAGITIDHNEIAGNNTDDWERLKGGCGCTGGGKFWYVTGAVVTHNWVHGNHSVGLWADTNNRGFQIDDNYIEDNFNYGLIYEISYNAQIRNNVFERNGLGAGPSSQGFPTGAIYISESGSDPRVAGPYGRQFAITGNTFVNNWGGVILWENSNRYCNSPANTSSGACTLVAPSSITTSNCSSKNIARNPYYADCRWKTQNVTVSHNQFDFDPSSLGSACTARNMCGFQGLFSEYGSFPAWSPYHGAAVEKHITLQQNNHFADNTYTGPWRFMIMSEGNVVSWSTWRSAPYSQDRGSSSSG
jgi:Right handed beta helix region